MKARALPVVLACVFWGAHFVASLLAFAMLVVAPLHPDDFTDLEYLGARIILFPIFYLVTNFGSGILLAALNSALWSVAVYGLAAYFTPKVSALLLRVGARK
jgi:hypothetical protein